MKELIRLSRILVERDGSRLFKARNSPAIISVKQENGKLWIKRVGGRLHIRLSFYKDNARTCVYNENIDGEVDVGPWGPWLVPFRDEIRRRLVLDALL